MDDQHNLPSQPTEPTPPPVPAVPHGRHFSASHPLEQTSRAIMSAAQAPGERMNPDVKASQRSDVLAKAQTAFDARRMMKESSPEPRHTPHATRNPFPKWFVWSFAGAALVLVLAVVGVTRLTPGSAPGVQKIARVLIPEAHAGDAFTLFAERADATGLEQDSSFVLKSQVAITPDELKRSIRIEPAVDVAVKSAGDGTYRIEPSGDLKSNTVYRVSIPTEVKRPDGTAVVREFSWAFQTKDEFRVLSKFPGDGAPGVPVDTGIEFKLSAEGWENVTSSFEIVPAVTGRFESHGRSLVFVPQKPLRYGTRYAVTLKKAFTLAASGQTLPEDAKIRFETSADPAKNQGTPFRVSVPEFFEVRPGKDDIQLQTFSYFGPDDAASSTLIDVTGYMLSPVEAKALLEKRLAIPEYAYVEQSRFDAYEALKKSPAFKLTTRLERPHPTAPLLIRLPAQERPGIYAVKFEPKGGETNWMFLQVTNLANYLVADRKTVVAWLVNPATNRPLGSVHVTSDEGATFTDETGVARLPAPDFLATTTVPGDAASFRLYRLELGSETAFAMLKRSPYGPVFDFGFQTASEDAWQYLMIDRPIYRATDSLHVFGFAQDRASRHGVGEVELRFSRNVSFFAGDAGSALKTERVTTDRDGFYQTDFSWDRFLPGWYTVTAFVKGKFLGARTLEIREFTKPTYAIEIVPEHERLYGGDVLRGKVRAAFYDGTPVPRAKIVFTHQQRWGDEHAQTLTTDENGEAIFTVAADRIDCPADPVAYCEDTQTLSLRARPESGEEGEIVGTARATVYASTLSIDVEPETTDVQATMRIRTGNREARTADDLPGPWANRKVTGYLQPRYYERRENGSYYDFIEKKVRPSYAYETRYEAQMPFELTTDASGRATYAFPMQKDREYVVVIEGKDDQARRAFSRWVVAPGWYASPNAWSPRAVDKVDPTLVLKPASPQDKYRLGERLTARYEIAEGQLLPSERMPGVLFVVANRGLREVSVAPEATHAFTFDETLVPNAVVEAITWWNGKFVRDSRSFRLDTETRDLNVSLTPDRASYAPGETVRIRVRAQTKDGARAAGATVAFAAIDKALAGVTDLTEEDPLTALYAFVSEGITFEGASHQDRTFYGGGGGAEMGGGGPDIARTRRLFKDTAAADAITLDVNGEGEWSFTAPDNLTTWRVQSVAIAPDIRAGAKVLEIPVTKPVFADAVLPARLLAGDQPVAKLRAYGAGLPYGSAVKFSVEAPNLNLHWTATGTATVPVFLTLPRLPAGAHAVTTAVTGSQGGDALERKLTVVDSNYRHDEYVRVEAAPGVGLPELGVAYADIRLMSAERAALLPWVRSLSTLDTARADGRVAARLMRDLLRTSYNEPNLAPETSSLLDYQDMTGGLRLLPYAGTDAELSSAIAATAPDYFDRTALVRYLTGVLDNRFTARSERVDALSGLAALHEPVLAPLQELAKRDDLTWRERLSVARGLTAAGDLERAKAILESFLAHAEERDQVMWIQVSEKPLDVYEATAEAAALATSLAHPKAEKLRTYVETNWEADAFPVLAQARYLKTLVPALLSGETTLAWTLDGRTEESVTFTNDPQHVLTLTADEAKRFRVTRVSGPVTITYIRESSGKPASVPEVAISRTYEMPNGPAKLAEGDIVRITLRPQWQARAQDGCYTVRDYLPGGFEPVLNWSGYFGGSEWYPYEVSEGRVSFYTCKNVKQPPVISYLVRVVARGTYKAEAPIVQHETNPMIAAVGVDQIVTVK